MIWWPACHWKTFCSRLSQRQASSKVTWALHQLEMTVSVPCRSSAQTGQAWEWVEQLIKLELLPQTGKMASWRKMQALSFCHCNQRVLQQLHRVMFYSQNKIDEARSNVVWCKRLWMKFLNILYKDNALSKIFQENRSSSLVNNEDWSPHSAPLYV